MNHLTKNWDQGVGVEIKLEVLENFNHCIPMYCYTFKTLLVKVTGDFINICSK